MTIEINAYHDDDGELVIERVCGWCGSNKGFYKKRVSNSHRGARATYHEVVTYCRECDADLVRENDGYTLD